jgi:hypothetical protein
VTQTYEQTRRMVGLLEHIDKRLSEIAENTRPDRHNVKVVFGTAKPVEMADAVRAAEQGVTKAHQELADAAKALDLAQENAAYAQNQLVKAQEDASAFLQFRLATARLSPNARRGW